MQPKYSRRCTYKFNFRNITALRSSKCISYTMKKRTCCQSISLPSSLFCVCKNYLYVLCICVISTYVIFSSLIRVPFQLFRTSPTHSKLFAITYSLSRLHTANMLHTFRRIACQSQIRRATAHEMPTTTHIVVHTRHSQPCVFSECMCI